MVYPPRLPARRPAVLGHAALRSTRFCVRAAAGAGVGIAGREPRSATDLMRSVVVVRVRQDPPVFSHQDEVVRGAELLKEAAARVTHLPPHSSEHA
jgi:hypothetical protein